MLKLIAKWLLLASALLFVAYVYRGELRTTPPTWTLATDVILYHLTSMIHPANEPGYVVLIYPADCAAPLALPWARLPIS